MKRLLLLFTPLAMTACTLGDGIMLNVDPVGWCMKEYTFYEEKERKQYCQTTFLAERRGIKEYAAAQPRQSSIMDIPLPGQPNTGYRPPASLPTEKTLTTAQCSAQITEIHRRYGSDYYGMSVAQKELFEGVCSHHPQARGYVASAEQGMRENRPSAPRPSSPSSGGVSGGTQRNSAPGASTGTRAPPASAQSSREHDPAGAAHNCARPNPQHYYGGFTNTCPYPISIIHCFQNPQQDRTDTSFYHCDRPGGLWAKSTTAGNIAAGATAKHGMPVGGKIWFFACRAPYGIRDAHFTGNGISAKCVR